MPVAAGLLIFRICIIGLARLLVGMPQQWPAGIGLPKGPSPLGTVDLALAPRHPSTSSGPLHRDQAPGMDLEFLRCLLDGLVCIGRLDASDDFGLVGCTIDIPGHQLGRFRFLRHGGSIGRKGKYLQSG